MHNNWKANSFRKRRNVRRNRVFFFPQRSKEKGKGEFGRKEDGREGDNRTRQQGEPKFQTWSVLGKATL
jgi:hypothetical protein